MNTAEKFFLRGVASEYLNDYVAAFEDFKRTLELDPRHVAAWFERGRCLNRYGKILAAIKCFGNAITLDTQHAKAYMERGKCFAHMKKFKAAVKDFSRVIEIYPDPLDDDYDRAILSAEAFYQRANVYERLGDIKAAEADHRQAMNNYVADMMFYMSADDVTDIIFGNEKPPEPTQEDTLAEEWQSLATSSLCRGKISFELGDFNNALKDFDKIIAAVPNVENFFDTKVYDGNKEVRIELMQKYFPDITNASKTKDFLRTLLATAYIGRGKCFQQLGDAQKAQADFDAAKDTGGSFLDFAGC